MAQGVRLAARLDGLSSSRRTQVVERKAQLPQVVVLTTKHVSLPHVK